MQLTAIALPSAGVRAERLKRVACQAEEAAARARLYAELGQVARMQRWTDTAVARAREWGMIERGAAIPATVSGKGGWYGV